MPRPDSVPLAAVHTAAALSAFALVAAGCGSQAALPDGGSAALGALSPKALAQARRERDGDRDNDSYGLGPLDDDNDAIPTRYSRLATPAARQAIVALVRRYYAAAAAEAPARVCSLLYPLGAENFVEEHRHGRGPAWQRGSTCRQIAAKTLRREHQRLVQQNAALKVKFVRLRERHGWVVADFGAANERWLLIHREGPSWMLAALTEEPL